MSRLVWVALGAAGGVVAYRKGQQLLEDAKRKGVVGSVQAASGSAAGFAQGARSLIGKALEANPSTPESAVAVSRPSGTAAARALAESKRTRTTENSRTDATS